MTKNVASSHSSQLRCWCAVAWQLVHPSQICFSMSSSSGISLQLLSSTGDSHWHSKVQTHTHTMNSVAGECMGQAYYLFPTNWRRVQNKLQRALFSRMYLKHDWKSLLKTLSYGETVMPLDWRRQWHLTLEWNRIFPVQAKNCPLPFPLVLCPLPCQRLYLGLVSKKSRGSHFFIGVYGDKCIRCGVWASSLH